MTVHTFDHSALPDLDEDEQALAQEELEAELEKLAEDAVSGEDAISEEVRSCLCATVNLADSPAPSLRSQGEACSSSAPRTKGPDLRGACFSDAEMGHGIVLSLNAGHNQNKYAFMAVVIKAGVVSLELYDDYKPKNLVLGALDSTVEDTLVTEATAQGYALTKVRRLCACEPPCRLRLTECFGPWTQESDGKFTVASASGRLKRKRGDAAYADDARDDDFGASDDD